MCRATIDARDDFRAVWWLTVEDRDADSSDLQDELHVELVAPPGRYGASREFVRDFKWTSFPLGRVLTWTFTPRSKLPSIKAVAELVAEREM